MREATTSHPDMPVLPAILSDPRIALTVDPGTAELDPCGECQPEGVPAAWTVVTIIGGFRFVTTCCDVSCAAATAHGVLTAEKAHARACERAGLPTPDARRIEVTCWLGNR
jgi:hypothetical protein